MDDPNLESILYHHVLNGTISSIDLVDGKVRTINGNQIEVSQTPNNPLVEGNKIDLEAYDLEATMGYAHSLQGVLVPTYSHVADVAIQSEVHTVLEDAVLNYASESIAAALTDPAAELTLFAPTDEAFTALLASNDEWNSLADIPQETLDAVLLNHVVAGEVTSDMLENGSVRTLNGNTISIDKDNLTIDDANIVAGAFDILTPNGAVHVIDAVLVPAYSHVADVAIQSEVHTVLEDAVLNYASESIAAALTDPAAELTLFAPTDEAFTALLASNDEWNSLADIPQETLDAVLLNHVVAGEVTSDMLENGSVRTLNGNTISIDMTTLLLMMLTS